ncbi:hypothetical protein JV173_03335 [Acholeplasma equirhinis]|uniref:hypothetical protein n=1 Tax=Acholeplasma equirhinis TaxID=555393 RepID=UPI00197B0507|nr:hypothetical protein [Acholeplasma equirhinis]MBN3490542.1 hypothetical protein [Acholeplasma equirhinis]
MQNAQETKVVPFVELKNLTKEDVKKYPLFPVKLRRTVTKSGIQTSVTLKLNESNLQIPLVSSERLSNGSSRQLRYFQPDIFIALILELDLPQVDENGKDLNDWNIKAAVRFVKGKYKSDKEYFSLEIVFKQYKYHVHFLSQPQITILEHLIKNKKLVDVTNKPVKVDWIVRPDAIDDIEELEDFSF